MSADDYQRAVHELTRDGLKPRDVSEVLGVHPRAVRAALGEDRPAETAHNRRSRVRPMDAPALSEAMLASSEALRSGR